MTAPGPAGSPARRPEVGNVSVGELVGEVSQDLSALMRQELALAKAELKQEALKSGKAAGLLGGAGFAGYMLLLFLSVAAWWGLSNVMDQAWAALIVAAVWAVIAAVLYAAGRNRMGEVNPAPERTAETLKQLPGTLKGR
jgi:Putative Actinobacterial Holin-X, holin superfamily III